MKTTLITTIKICIFTLVTQSSCGLSEHKTNDIFDRVRLERMTTKISDTTKSEIPVNTKIKKEVVETKPSKSVEIIDEWILFKMETDLKFLANENTIKEIKGIPQPKPKLVRKLARLEDSNNGLIKQINNYDQTIKPDWGNFKQKMNRDIDRIGTDLAELAIVDKK